MDEQLTALLDRLDAHEKKRIEANRQRQENSTRENKNAASDAYLELMEELFDAWPTLSRALREGEAEIGWHGGNRPEGEGAYLIAYEVWRDDAFACHGVCEMDWTHAGGWCEGGLYERGFEKNFLSGTQRVVAWAYKPKFPKQFDSRLPAAPKEEKPTNDRSLA